MNNNVRSTHFRWVIIALLFLVTVVNYVDRASISFAIPEIAKHFHLDKDQEGWILGAFGFGYLVTTLLGGIAVDRYGSRMILSLGVLLWSFSLLIGGLSVGFTLVFLSRVILGLAEGPNFPAMTRAVGDWLPSQECNRAFSYSLFSVPFALAIGGPIVSRLIVHFGWRGMFFVLAVAALVWLPFWWFLFRNFPENSPYVNAAELKKIREGKDKDADFNHQSVIDSRKNTQGLWRYLLTSRTLLVNYWAFFVFGYYIFFFMNWLPSYLELHFHVKLLEVGLFTVLPWGFAFVLMWVVGCLADYIYKKTGSYRYSRSHPIWISQLLAGLCILPVVISRHVDVAMIFISLAVGFSMCTNAAYYATNIDIIKERAGTALGIMDAAFAVAGFAAPIITGWIISLTGGHFESAFYLLAALSLSSVVLVLLFHQPDIEKQRPFQARG